MDLLLDAWGLDPVGQSLHQRGFTIGVPENFVARNALNGARWPCALHVSPLCLSPARRGRAGQPLSQQRTRTFVAWAGLSSPFNLLANLDRSSSLIKRSPLRSWAKGSVQSAPAQGTGQQAVPVHRHTMAVRTMAMAPAGRVRWGIGGVWPGYRATSVEAMGWG